MPRAAGRGAMCLSARRRAGSGEGEVPAWKSSLGELKFSSVWLEMHSAPPQPNPPHRAFLLPWEPALAPPPVTLLLAHPGPGEAGSGAHREGQVFGGWISWCPVQVGEVKMTLTKAAGIAATLELCGKHSGEVLWSAPWQVSSGCPLSSFFPHVRPGTRQSNSEKG